VTSTDDIERYEVAGISIAAVTPLEAAVRLIRFAVESRPLQVHLCNAYTITSAQSDRTLLDALSHADLNLPDGTPVAWLGRRAGTQGPVRGPELMRLTISRGRELGHYLYGGAPGVAEDLAATLTTTFPGTVISGFESPPFGPIDEEELNLVAKRIAASGASVVWIGLGTPKQDHIVPRLAQRLDMVLVPVGAAFDFITERTPEAPPQLRATGLEWLYRLAHEPRRLWRRYLIGNPHFLLLVIRGSVARISSRLRQARG
jgi:N-acetylglucosaminyldiphosphoundecaprenol N-acetyl-beta-D-mannosaminyltransferase